MEQEGARGVLVKIVGGFRGINISKYGGGTSRGH
jgi:hypothetical protein